MRSWGILVTRGAVLGKLGDGFNQARTQSVVRKLGRDVCTTGLRVGGQPLNEFVANDLGVVMVVMVKLDKFWGFHAARRLARA